MRITCLNDRYSFDFQCQGKEASRATAALETANYRDLPFNALISLYIMADSLLVRGLRDLIITLLIQVYGYDRLLDAPRGMMLGFWEAASKGRTTVQPSPAVGINLAWAKTPHNCHLRAVLLLLYCDNANRTSISQEPYCPEFLREAFFTMTIRWLRDSSTTQWTANGAICRYHIHDAGCPLLIDFNKWA